MGAQCSSAPHEAVESEGAANPYTLYVRDKGARSMRVMVFLLDAGLKAHVRIVREADVPAEVESEVKAQFQQRITELHAAGKTWLPCLKHAGGYVLEDDQVIEHLTEEFAVDKAQLTCQHIFENGMLKDYGIMRHEMQRLAENGADFDGDGKVTDAESWVRALDVDGDGNVSLDELIAGLDITRLLAEERRGARANVQSARWLHAKEQVELLVRQCPQFADGWRLRMLVGTITDTYDWILDSADKIQELSPGDPQALTLKAFYCNALKRPGYREAMEGLAAAAPAVAARAKKLVARVDKYWDQTLSATVPAKPGGKACILALGSPADDDGTPRPRLLGTLNKTLEAAKAHPAADIFVTGAAVSSNMPEAVAMKTWLAKRGVDPKRVTMEMKAMDTVGNYEYIAPMLVERGVTKVILITVYYHLNRSSALADAVFEQRGLSVEVLGVAGESDLKGADLEARMGVERPASYRDVARAEGLYEKADFDSAAK